VLFDIGKSGDGGVAALEARQFARMYCNVTSINAIEERIKEA
jgi:hypothetical protein